jgi:hypothetical protein
MSMTNWSAALLWLALSQSAAAAAAAGDSVQNNWLMMVTTQNTDPAKAAEFNDWYDNIDVPDVLKVPGYERARRGAEQRISEFGPTESQKDPLRYVALYDIKSKAIDKTIIGMLMASWGMEKSHHSTDLLKVTERVYFHQFGPTHSTPNPKAPKAHPYIYMTRFDCCRDSTAARSFNDWYDRKYVPAVLASAGFTRISRYKLYWVLMDHPVKMPGFLSVIELTADSAEQAAQNVQEVRTRLSEADQANLSVIEGTRSLFLQIKDAKRP